MYMTAEYIKHKDVVCCTAVVQQMVVISKTTCSRALGAPVNSDLKFVKPINSIVSRAHARVNLISHQWFSTVQQVFDILSLSLSPIARLSAT